MNNIPTLSLVIPIFNEVNNLDLFISRTLTVFAAEKNKLELIFVDDGSTDNSLLKLLDLQKEYSSIKIIELSRNFGKEGALSAGLIFSSGQIVVPIDADLQHPPEIIIQMIEKWREGFDVVLARRINRNTDSIIRRFFSNYFYSAHNFLSDQKIPTNVGDFRLMDRAVVNAINSLPESRRFMKGLFCWVGFRTTSVDYEVASRVSGSSKFNGLKLWSFAIEGIASFSTVPLKMWSYLGIFVTICSFLYGAYVTFRVIQYGVDVPGYASLMVAIIFFSGIQLIGIGVLGEYLARTYSESKRRPVFIVRKVHASSEERPIISRIS